MGKYALFLGCTVPSRGRNYEMAARMVAEKLGIELVDIPEFTCCGFPLRAVSFDTTLLMSARNLALAEAKGLNITTLCSACTSFQAEANHALKHDPKLLAKVNEQLKEIGLSYKGTVELKHFARVIYEEVGVEKVAAACTRKLDGLKIACHYGCHYTKPSEAVDHFENPEAPVTLEKLIEATGAKVTRYDDYLQCCGGAILGIEKDLAYGLAGAKLDHVQAQGADCINLICPFCAVMYDDNQREMEAAHGKEYKIPVLYLPQILGLAMGMGDKELGLKMNKVKTKELLDKLQ